jgi:hypothetical protein
VLGLQIRHGNLEAGTLSIEQRNWHQNIDNPKTEKSRRKLAVAGLVSRYREWIAGHATVRMTEEYTVVQLGRQEELTRRIQEKLLLAKERAAGKKLVPITPKEPAA